MHKMIKPLALHWIDGLSTIYKVSREPALVPTIIIAAIQPLLLQHQLEAAITSNEANLRLQVAFKSYSRV